MTTRTKRDEKNAGRRAEYGDKRVSGQLDQMAAKIQAEEGLPLAEARSKALRMMIRGINSR